MATKTPVTYGRLARLRAQRQAASKVPEDDSEPDPIDSIPSPTRSPQQRRKAKPSPGATSPQSRKAQHELALKRPVPTVVKPSTPSPTLDRSSNKVRSSTSNAASSSPRTESPIKRRHAASKPSPADEASARDPSRSPKRRRLSKFGTKDGPSTCWKD